jgi:hypothetical protein
MAEIFSTVKNLTTAHCLNWTSSQHFILTGTEQELWIAMGWRLHMMERRYHVIAWSWFYPIFITLTKNIIEEANLFSPPLYVQVNTVSRKCKTWRTCDMFMSTTETEQGAGGVVWLVQLYNCCVLTSMNFSTSCQSIKRERCCNVTRTYYRHLYVVSCYLST